jgi:hypothetical protein
LPDLSVVVPFERGHQFLVAALDGLLHQSIPTNRIETLIVTPPGVMAPKLARHKRLRIRNVAWPQRRSLASALNAGARVARAPLLVLLQARWRPLRGLAEYCLSFHRAYPSLTDVATLGSVLDPAMNDDPLLWWLDQQQLAGLTAPACGIHNWRALRFDALSMRRDLLRRHALPAGQNDEWLIKEQWSRRAPIRVFVDQAPVLTTAAPPVLGAVMIDDYLASYARLKAMRASSQTFAGEYVDDRFQHPEKYVLAPVDREELIVTIEALTRELAGRNPRFAVGDEAEKFALLGRLYMIAVSHARALGWSDARTGRTPNPTRI